MNDILPNTLTNQILLLVGICIVAWIIGLVKWAKPMFEGEDGLASSKRVFPFVLILLCVYMILFDKTPLEARKWIYGINLLAATIYAGYITIPQVLSGLKTIKGGKEETEMTIKGEVEGTLTTKND